MKNRTWINLLQTISLCFFLIGCSDEAPQESADSYIDPHPLTIGVVGNPPKVNETRVQFKKVDLKELNQNIDHSIDALFIMPEHLKEAGEPQYADLYKKLPYPTFFIGSKKMHTAFTEKDVSYDTAFTGDSLAYTRGFVQLENGQPKVWEFGLYNDEVNEKSIKEMYTRIFKAIIKFKNNPLSEQL